MLMRSEGPMSDYTGAKLLYPHLPAAETLIADKGYDSDEFRDALAATGITPCIPSKSNRLTQTEYDKELYRTRGRIEIMFGRLMTGAAWPCASTAPLTPFFLRSASLQPSSFGAGR